MATSSESSPGAGPGCPARLKRVDPALLDEWARQNGYVDAADSIDRMAVDAELVVDMALEGFAGPVWDRFANELAKYAVAVLQSWMGTGMIYKQCAEKKRPLTPLGRPFDQDEIEGLADEAVGEALKFFKERILMTHKWDPAGGASLRTYFIGQCILRFPTVYRPFFTQVERDAYLVFGDPELGDPPGRAADGPANVAVLSVMAESALTSIKDRRVRIAMRMTAHGWPQADIAQHLGVTVKAVERMIANERIRQHKTRGSA